MIKNSIVAKLLVTIISLFIVVLLLLSMFLEQLFDNYFFKNESDRLEHRIEHMADVLLDYQSPVNQWIISELAREERGEDRCQTEPTKCRGATDMARSDSRQGGRGHGVRAHSYPASTARISRV